MIGGAAHSTTPFQGHGAAQSIEHSFVLETLLGKTEDKAHIAQAFTAFNQGRRSRTKRVVITSRRSEELMGMKAPGIGDDIVKMRERMQTRMNWIWNSRS